jgi:hypothetical protein
VIQKLAEQSAMNPFLPNAKSSQANDPARERERLRRLVTERGLCGLANDTKWNEFISAMRARESWRPSFRWKGIAGSPTEWDVEWFYHLPFPFIAVEWFDVAYLQETKEHRLPPRIHITDHSAWIEAILKSAGLDYDKGKSIIRVFGYSPKDYSLFDVE